MRILDLSAPIAPSPADTPPFLRTEIDYGNHAAGATQVQALLGVTTEATGWLYDQGVRVIGIDAWGWDAPLDRQAREALTHRLPGIFWAAHQVDLPYAQIERLVNLDTLPPFGFKISCFPLKIVGGSAGPARVVALLDD